MKHSAVEAQWRCTVCAAEFCEDCIPSPKTHYNERVAGCPECHEQCIDFKKQAENLRWEDKKDAEGKKSRTLRHTVFILLSLPFAIDVVTWAPCGFISDFKFMLFLLGLFGPGPARKVDLVYQGRFLLTAFFLLFMGSLVIGPTSPLKYLILGIVFMPIYYFAFRVAHLGSRIYR